MLIYILDNDVIDIDLAPLPPLPFTLRNRTYTRNTYCIAIEAKIGVESRDELEADITTDTGTNIEDMVDSNDGGDFNLIRAEDDQIDTDMDDN